MNKITECFSVPIVIAIVLVLLLSVACCPPANAWPVDHEGNRIFPKALLETCLAKGDVVMFTYRHRDQLSEEQMLGKLTKDWTEVWSKNPNIKHVTYVDMQRHVRDAYRTDSQDNYVRECCTNEIEDGRVEVAMNECFYQTQY